MSSLCMQWHIERLSHSWNPPLFLKGGEGEGADQLSKIGNLGGGDKITLSKMGGQMKKERVSEFLLVFCR